MTMAYLGDTGIVLNGSPDSKGVAWSWSGSDPWSPSPAPKEVTGDNVNDHGSWDSTRFYGPRSYALEGYATAPDHTTLHEAKTRLFAACGLSLDMRVIEPGYDRTGHFRRTGEPLWSEDASLIRARFSAQLWARDPRAYSTVARTGTAGFPSSVGGLTWPATWPATWSAVVTNGELQLTNDGTETAWPVFRIDGPVVNPTIVNSVTGQQMHLDLALVAGQWVTVDTGSHLVLADGSAQASRRDKFWGDWFGLLPGSNTIRFMGDSASAGALLTATYNDVWI